VPLKIQFGALSQYANGTNQIIDWALVSGKQQINFPNGDDQLMWQVGDSLSLGLRWASGSAFVPLQQPDTPVEAPLQVDQQQLTAKFVSRGRWGLFEWLARYAGDDVNDSNRENEWLLAFHVPVVLKAQASDKDKAIKSPTQAYVSRSNLLIWAQRINAKGDTEKLSLPGLLPAFAPGFND
jgi:type VI secretion system protein ImpL